MGLRGVIATFLLGCALCGNARAASSGHYNASRISCAEFVGRYSAEVASRKTFDGTFGDALHTTDFIAIYHYVLGWLSAYNMLTADTYDILPNGLDGALLRLNDYCSANPLKNLDDGLQALVAEAYPSRQQKPPGQ